MLQLGCSRASRESRLNHQAPPSIAQPRQLTATAVAMIMDCQPTATQRPATHRTMACLHTRRAFLQHAMATRCLHLLGPPTPCRVSESPQSQVSNPPSTLQKDTEQWHGPRHAELSLNAQLGAMQQSLTSFNKSDAP